MKNLFNSGLLLVAMVILPSACSHSEEHKLLSPSSEADLAGVEAFKKQVGQNRLEAWNKLQPLLASRLPSVPKSQPALESFFQQWLGPSEDTAVQRSEVADAFPLSPKPNRGDIFAYQLSNEDNFNQDLVVDFRNPEKVTIGIVSSYDPPANNSSHDQISADEKRIAAELHATEINLGGGSQDGSAKLGFWVRLEDAQVNEAAVRKAAKLTTLVSLQLRGSNITDACLSTLKGHTYLASLELDSTSVSDEGLTNLTGLEALKWLTVAGGRTTKAGVDTVRAALPNCKIDFQAK